ncbi:hypothetical protein GCM10010521_63080 [Streptomyces rameus]|uniref:Uncharacterized protein n=1 Tax=Streptomyces rameus TaxID=68261 RepID=A0ABN3V2L7_9ACTN
MFFATPRLRWNSPKRRLPSKASRTISKDHQSPIASTDRATGHSLSSNRVLVTMASLTLIWLQHATNRTTVTVIR